jgi:hypothetical protein
MTEKYHSVAVQGLGGTRDIKRGEFVVAINRQRFGKKVS